MSDLEKLFAKYMKEKDPKKAHAILSASGSERWLGCPGSVKLSQGIPSVDSDASVRGTNTHTLLQFILENPRNWKELLETPHGHQFKWHIECDAKMLENALLAASYIQKAYKKMREGTEGLNGWRLHMMIEEKLELKGIGFGTSDAILHRAPYGPLHVIDYKNGVKAVDPVGNTQGLYYAVAAADRFNWKFSSVQITIIQPNLASGPSISSWHPTWDDLEMAEKAFQKGAALTQLPDAPLVKNDKWCWFCPARQKCPLQAEVRNKKAFDKFQ